MVAIGKAENATNQLETECRDEAHNSIVNKDKFSTRENSKTKRGLTGRMEVVLSNDCPNL